MACIVIADDDTDIAEFITYSFHAAGHTVYTALDGKSALELARRYLPHLVVIDYAMPGLTGLQVAAALRSDARTSRLPILMITGNDLSDDHAALVDRLVSKPLRPPAASGHHDRHARLRHTRETTSADVRRRLALERPGRQ